MVLDDIIFRFITEITLSNEINQAISFVLATLLIWFLVIWYAVVAIWHKRSRLKELLALGLGAAMVYLFNTLVSMWWWRPRPFLSMAIDPVINVGLTKSFPSDHTSLAFFLAYLLFKCKRNWWWSFIIAGLVGFGRVAAGVHYPLDILAGSVVGVALGYLTIQVEKLFSTNKS